MVATGVMCWPGHSPEEAGLHLTPGLTHKVDRRVWSRKEEEMIEQGVRVFVLSGGWMGNLVFERVLFVRIVC